MTPGDESFVFDGCGREYRCRFRDIQNSHARLDVLEELGDVVESPLQLELAQALAKGEKFDFIIQKATELGVTSIAPLATRYAEIKLDEQQTTKRLERWRRISLEALKQCGRRKLVEVVAPRTLREFLGESELSDDPKPRHRILVFSEAGGVAVDDALAELSEATDVVVMIGPEGGWNDDELSLLQERGCTAITLGPRVLRTETAAVVAITLIQHAIGDLSVRESQ
jgi:16S rRNA (uracil1498-N3)-methyltransferase